MTDKKLNCCVIMPFSRSSEKHSEEYWTNHFNKFLKPLIEELEEVGAYRVESLHGDIVKRIITDLIVSPIVIAELTDHNPNVFWELGVRQSFKHNTITIAEEGTEIPFDISSNATLFYNPSDHLKMEEFHDKLKKAIMDCIKNPEKSDSYVLDAISGRGTLFEIMRIDEAKRRVESLIEEIKLNQEFYNSLCEIALKEGSIIDKIIKREGQIILFQTQSAELLLSNRYLEESQKFYKVIRYYLYNILSTTEYLNRIPTLLILLGEREDVDHMIFFKGKLKRIYNALFDNTLRNLEKVYKKLIKKVSMYSSGTSTL